YELPVSDEAWRQTAEDVRCCLETFYTSELFARLRAVPRTAWLEVEEFSSFLLDGVKVWAVIDCSFRDGQLVDIYDWKTGRRVAEEGTLQLQCYALYAHQTWGTAIDNVRLAEYYLLLDHIQDYQVTASDIEDARAYILGSVEDMQSLVADVAHNVPLAEEAFTKTEDLRECRRCNYVGLCRPEVAASLKA
ncbi:MAG: PD-(D/E)XK nuclease family protein, partial [Planctomycetota bacterium]